MQVTITYKAGFEDVVSNVSHIRVDELGMEIFSTEKKGADSILFDDIDTFEVNVNHR